ncbi:hypothetical protein BgiMline_030303 [Biomphalaria glabrata]|nr:hypothetical protein BgiMline_032855 [Biomphalaria glabrata]
MAQDVRTNGTEVIYEMISLGSECKGWLAFFQSSRPISYHLFSADFPPVFSSGIGCHVVGSDLQPSYKTLKHFPAALLHYHSPLGFHSEDRTLSSGIL